ncbi:hypothetical protein QBC43DRAFT_339951 [Cladorrhinum sp. PSN259]|nr:hypothetical protein QBC43DRAFT_339951 [Cladorrhinum sp. PSN259]
MAYSRHPSSHLSMGLPIMLGPDVEGNIIESESMPEPPRRRKTEPQQQSSSSSSSSAPQHPIPSMQDAFAESLFEATKSEGSGKPKLRNGDAKARRAELLDGAHSDPHPTALWRFRPGQHAHELRRLMAQISFGVYLLLNGMANSQMLVVSILQGHIDEVDEFLETTLEDVELATTDVKDRISHLKLPMDNIQVFETMLEDARYRRQILEGNEKIEHILARTQISLKQTMQDLAEGLSATRDFTIYLAEQHHGPWRQERPDVIDIFDAMKGNTDGWFNAFMDLQAKGSELNALVVQLAGMVQEMDRRAAEASHRQRSSVTPYSPKHSPQPSDASTITTPPTSPPPRTIPNSPPRLSLRLSTINAITESEPTSYFNFSIDEEPEATAAAKPATEPAAPPVQVPTQPSSTTGYPSREEDETTPTLPRRLSAQPPAPESLPESPAESPPRSPPVRNPRRLSERPGALLDAPQLQEASEKKEESEDGTLYLLQPKVYTPQPSPQPSPRIKAETARLRKDASRSREELRPREFSTHRGSSRSREESPEPQFESAAQLKIDSPNQRVNQATKTQVPRLKVVEIGARTKPIPKRSPQPDQRPDSRSDPRFASRPEQRYDQRSDQRSDYRLDRQSDLYTANFREERLSDYTSDHRSDHRPDSLWDPAQAPELVPEPDLEVDLYPKQRTSLRDRVSLKTNPPDSIQVPPPNTLAHPSIMAYQTYQAPDSAYGSDMERPPVNSLASINSSLADFSPPFVQPGMIPSPHSDRQFFRPVQANPYSPLQQRPHTSGTVGPQVHAPPRNIPSAMGMSVMSASTMHSTDTSSKTIKKKRSAFGWLKKAFSLDEEERAAFEAKKQQQLPPSPYYGPQSPQFLDGKRIQPRPGY